MERGVVHSLGVDGEGANGKVNDVGWGENADRRCAVAAWPATSKAGHDNAIVLRGLPSLEAARPAVAGG